MADVKGYYIARVKTGSGDAYALHGPDGETVPCQMDTLYEHGSDDLPAFTVTFQAGWAGIPVKDIEPEG